MTPSATFDTQSNLSLRERLESEIGEGRNRLAIHRNFHRVAKKRRPDTRKERRKLQRIKTKIHRAKSCEGKRPFSTFEETIAFVADRLRKTPWITRAGYLRKADPIFWNLNAYRCGFGDHYHLGHVREDWVYKLEQFREIVLDYIALEILPELIRELELISLVRRSALGKEAI